MQPSRAFSFRLASTTSALHSTNVPWWSRVFGCSDTSTAKTRAPTPTCGAASPTQPGLTRIVATRSAASCTVSGARGSTRPPTVESTVAGARTTSSTLPRTPSSAADQARTLSRFARSSTASSPSPDTSRPPRLALRSQDSAARSVAPTPSAAAASLMASSTAATSTPAGRSSSASSR